MFLAAVTAAQDVLLSNQLPPLYDAASGGPHHLTLTLRLVGFIRLVVILCVLRYLGCRPVVKLHSANIAAHISPHPVMRCFFMGGVGHCAAISGFWAASRARFARYRSTHLQVGRGLPSGLACLTSTVLRYLTREAESKPKTGNIAAHTPAAGLGMSGSWGLPSDLGRLTSTVLRYLDSRHPSDPVSANIAAHYSWPRIPGRGEDVVPRAWGSVAKQQGPHAHHQ